MDNHLSELDVSKLGELTGGRREGLLHVLGGVRGSSTGNIRFDPDPDCGINQPNKRRGLLRVPFSSLLFPLVSLFVCVFSLTFVFFISACSSLCCAHGGEEDDETTTATTSTTTVNTHNSNSHNSKYQHQ